MLKDNFYTVSNLEVNGTKAAAQISLNPKHPVYKGHFPNNPVTPGVCQIQIVKETLGRVYGKSLFLKSAKSVKFLNVLTPQTSPIDLTLDYVDSAPGVKVTAMLAAGETVFLKFSGYFQSELDGPS